jgi:hypothetical protein
MRSITARLAEPRLRLVARVAYYLAVLVAVVIVASLTGHADVQYVYQGF